MHKKWVPTKNGRFKYLTKIWSWGGTVVWKGGCVRIAVVCHAATVAAACKKKTINLSLEQGGSFSLCNNVTLVCAVCTDFMKSTHTQFTSWVQNPYAQLLCPQNLCKSMVKYAKVIGPTFNHYKINSWSPLTYIWWQPFNFN